MVVSMSKAVRMRRRFPWVALFLLTAVPAAAQDLLPTEFAGWRAGEVQRARPEAFDQIAPADAIFLREYRALAAERRNYTKDAASINVTLYRMRDPSAAYGAFTFFRTEEMAAADVTPYAASSRGRALAVVGNLLVDVTGKDVKTFTGDWKALVDALAPRADTSPFPPYSRYLPTEGLVRNSERYLIGPNALNRLIPLGYGDWIGFSDGAEVQMARYRRQGQDLTLLLVAYPTPQMAAGKLAEFGRWFNLNAERKGATSQPVLFAQRKSSLVAIVAETKSREVAEALLKGVQYETQLTWNEPGRSATERGMAEYLVETFVGIGLLMVFAAVVGIGYGGIRVIIKYLLPGKVFDRAHSVEIIQLGLSSKPIKGEDFY
jgi:hypothetical protein